MFALEERGNQRGTAKATSVAQAMQWPTGNDDTGHHGSVSTCFRALSAHHVPGFHVMRASLRKYFFSQPTGAAADRPTTDQALTGTYTTTEQS